MKERVLQHQSPVYRDRLDIEDGLDHVLAEIMFMQHALNVIFDNKDAIPGEEICFGISLVFDKIQGQIAAIGMAVQTVKFQEV